ncbi:MAG: carbon-nitrogen hydrolase family protein [Bacteroidales bacterium]|nr:carbon-nitrogen hydrolase family protein [Bacteroidales bacterium]
MSKNSISRRHFIQKTAVTTGIVTTGSFTFANRLSGSIPDQRKLSRDVWIASFSQEGIYADTAELMVRKVLDELKKLEPYYPDFVCLPEIFAFSNVKKIYSTNDRLIISKKIIEQFAEYSLKNSCYTICPVYTSDEKGNIFNSVVVIDRQGNSIGSYKKIHLTEGEIAKGLTPGSLLQPVIQTDFGKVGIQICFDILWDDGWGMYRDQGAEIIFFPSAFPGGQMVNAKAWQHKCVVVSSTRKNTSKICDITGQVITKTGFWDKNLVCASVNLEKAFLHTWPYVERFDEIRNKYGKKIKITNFHEEEWSILESLSPDVQIKDILIEFGLKTHEQHTHDAEMAQVKAREKNGAK